MIALRCGAPPSGHNKWSLELLANHDVLAVITDRKRGQGSSGDIEWFAADVMATQQYYPFGMLMPEDTSANVRRQYSLNSYDYRYGFNGKEGDDEVKGDDNQQDYGMRIYDPRVGRFLSVDPIAREYPELTPYQFASNTPIFAIDIDGLEAIGYSKLADVRNSEGKPVLQFAHSIDILNETIKFKSYLQKFANMKDTEGEDFGSVADGEYSNIRLEFRSDAYPAGDERNAGVTQVYVGDETSESLLQDPNLDVSKIGIESIKIRVTINTRLRSRADIMLTLLHEVILHVDKLGGMVKEVQNDKKSFPDFVSEYTQIVSTPESQQHIEVFQNNAESDYGSAINDLKRVFDSFKLKGMKSSVGLLRDKDGQNLKKSFDNAIRNEVYDYNPNKPSGNTTRISRN